MEEINKKEEERERERERERDCGEKQIMYNRYEQEPTFYKIFPRPDG